jgi:hypothetical protein
MRWPCWLRGGCWWMTSERWISGWPDESRLAFEFRSCKRCGRNQWKVA